MVYIFSEIAVKNFHNFDLNFAAIRGFAILAIRTAVGGDGHLPKHSDDEGSEKCKIFWLM